MALNNEYTISAVIANRKQKLLNFELVLKSCSPPPRDRARHFKGGQEKIF